MRQLPTLDFFHPESFARDLNSVLTNHPGREKGVRVWEEVLHSKNFGKSGVCGGGFFGGFFCFFLFIFVQFKRGAAAPQPANVTLCLAFCLC